MPHLAWGNLDLHGKRWERGEVIPEAVITAIPAHRLQPLINKGAIRYASEDEARRSVVELGAVRVRVEHQRLSDALAKASTRADAVKAEKAAVDAQAKAAGERLVKADAEAASALRALEAHEKTHTKVRGNEPRKS